MLLMPVLLMMLLLLLLLLLLLRGRIIVTATLEGRIKTNISSEFIFELVSFLFFLVFLCTVPRGHGVLFFAMRNEEVGI